MTETPTHGPAAATAGGRIAIAYDSCAPFTRGGAETHYRGLSEELARRGHEVSYLTSRYWEGPATLRRDGVDLVAMTRRHGSRTGNRSIIAALRYAAGLLIHLWRHGGEFDAVEVAALPPTAAIAAAIGLLPHRGTPMITDWHEVWPRRTWTEELGAAGNLGWLAELVARRLGTPVAFSDLHARRLPRPATKVPEFISITPPTGPRGRGREAVMLCVGRLVPNKRFDLVPRTLVRVRELEPDRDWRAVIVGAGSEHGRIAAEAADCGVESMVEFRSDLSPDALSELFSGSAVLFHPSRREGFGIVLLEASAHGLPTVVCPAPDNAGVELIETGMNGVVARSAATADLADAVVTAARPGAEADVLAWWEGNRPRFSAGAAADAIERISGLDVASDDGRRAAT